MPPGSDALLRLQKMLESFVEGNDRSLGFANAIEGVLLDHFRDDEAFEDLLVALASYQPGGGDYLYDEASLKQICLDALGAIRSRLP